MIRSYCGSEIDVWSCGVILYALLSGTLPFDDDSISILFTKIREANYEMQPYFPEPAKDLIHRMLQPNPLNRISIQEIKGHRWYFTFLKINYYRYTFRLPLYLTLIDTTRNLGKPHEIDEEIFKKLFTVTLLSMFFYSKRSNLNFS
jgi:serine/threonine protein kinase